MVKQFWYLLVQFIAGVSTTLEPSITDLNLDVVPQMHEVGHAILCFSWLLFTAHAKTEKSKRSFKLASLK